MRVIVMRFDHVEAVRSYYEGNAGIAQVVRDVVAHGLCLAQVAAYAGNGEFLWESNAILNYFADGTDFLPAERLARARVLQWQFFEQYSHEPYIATARYINKYLGLPKEREAEYHGKQAGGHKALALMNAHLEKRRFFVGENPTIADISLYAYTHVAEEGGFDLSGYPNIQRWFRDFAAIPGYLTMQG